MRTSDFVATGVQKWNVFAQVANGDYFFPSFSNRITKKNNLPAGLEEIRFFWK